MSREEMKEKVVAAFKEYTTLKNDIIRGFIKHEHIKMVSDALSLETLNDEELYEIWEISHDYFDSLYREFAESGEIIGYKPYSEETEFARDTQSAWSEVINQEARKRRAGYVK